MGLNYRVMKVGHRVFLAVGFEHVAVEQPTVRLRRNGFKSNFERST